MAELTRYRVLRRHEGERMYEEGETRDARSEDVKHLVGKVLQPIGPAPKDEKSEAKAEPSSPANKAEGAAPANKSEPAPRKRGRK